MHTSWSIRLAFQLYFIWQTSTLRTQSKQNFYYPGFCLFTVSVYLCCKHWVHLCILCYWNTQVLQRHNLAVFAVWVCIPTLYFCHPTFTVIMQPIPHHLRASCIAEVWSCLEKQYHLHQISLDPVAIMHHDIKLFLKVQKNHERMQFQSLYYPRVFACNFIHDILKAHHYCICKWKRWKLTNFLWIASFFQNRIYCWTSIPYISVNNTLLKSEKKCRTYTFMQLVHVSKCYLQTHRYNNKTCMEEGWIF